MKENVLVNYEKDNVSLVLSKVPVGKCFSKYSFRWFVPDVLRYIIPKETSNNGGAKSPKILYFTKIKLNFLFSVSNLINY